MDYNGNDNVADDDGGHESDNDDGGVTLPLHLRPRWNETNRVRENRVKQIKLGLGSSVRRCRRLYMGDSMGILVTLMIYR